MDKIKIKCEFDFFATGKTLRLSFVTLRTNSQPTSTV